MCLCKQTGKIKSWTQSSHFSNNEGDLKEKNHGLRKITMLSIGYRNRAAVLEVCFHLKVETGFVTPLKMFNLQARRACQIATVRYHCSKGLATECLPKRQSHQHRDWLGSGCVN